MTADETALAVTDFTLAPIAEMRAKLQDQRYQQLIKQLYCPGASDLEFAHCMAQAYHLGLDPIARQIFFIAVWDSRLKREQWVPIVAVQGLAAIAVRTGEFAGRTKPEWCGPDAQWCDVWLGDEPPMAARVGVHRAGFVEPLYGIVTYREYCRRKKDGKPMALWATHPSRMLLKCAFAQALRESFPLEMAGDYGIKDISLPGEPGRFRIRDQTPQTPQALPEGPSVAAAIEAIRAASNLAELDAKTTALKEIDLTEADRDAARVVWQEAKRRVERSQDQGSKEAPAPAPAPAGEHDYGPPPWDETSQTAAMASDAGPSNDTAQSGFGFDDAQTK